MARRPVNAPYTITTPFGVADTNALFGLHSGTDYAVPRNTSVYAPASGKVVYADTHPIRGEMVVIYDGSVYHRLMHNSSLKVDVGDQVTEGQVVALSGSTGLSTGPHVHWDINSRGIDAKSFTDFVDPSEWLKTKGENMSADALTKQEIIVIYNGFFDTEDYEVPPDIIKAYTGKDLSGLLTQLHSDPTWLKHKAAVKNMSSGVNPQDSEDANKFRKLKELLK